MFREMRKKERQLGITETMEILRQGEYGVLSTTCNDSYPYGIPLNYALHNDAIYFHCAMEGHKLDNIENNQKVSFCVVGATSLLPESFSTKFESAILFGHVEEVFGEEKISALISLVNKYADEFMENGLKYINSAFSKTKVMKIHIDHLTGKARR